jgi:hypothetical protein
MLARSIRPSEICSPARDLERVCARILFRFVPHKFDSRPRTSRLLARAWTWCALKRNDEAHPERWRGSDVECAT